MIIDRKKLFNYLKIVYIYIDKVKIKMYNSQRKSKLKTKVIK